MRVVPRILGVFVPLACAGWMLTLPTMAQEERGRLQQLETENQMLRERVHSLEGEMGMLRAAVERLEAAPASAPTLPELELENAVNALAKKMQAEAPPMRARWPVKFYGYVKFDLSWDSSRTTPGNFVRWATPDNAAGGDDDQMNITARQTRLGFQFQGPSTDDLTTRALIETDFYGPGSNEYVGTLRMRRAFFELRWKKHDFNILAGQEWDLVGAGTRPLVAPTVKLAGLFWSGDVGLRKPQLRFTKGFKVGEEKKIELSIAFARFLGSSPVTTGQVDTGADAGWPNIQGAVGYIGTLWVPKQKARIGLFGHYGQEEYDFAGTSNTRDFDTWSAGLYVHLPLLKWLSLRGEGWIGENMGQYVGGIGQGVNAGSLEEIGAVGGYAALLFGPFDALRFNLGAGIDDPFGSDLNAGNRNENLIVFGNVFYDVNAAATVAFELMYVCTSYVDGEDEEVFRLQLAFIYRF